MKQNKHGLPTVSNVPPMPKVKPPKTEIKKERSPNCNHRAWTDPEELDRQVRKYFRDAIDKDTPQTTLGLSTYIGIHRDTFNEYRRGTYDDKEKGIIFSKILSLAKEKIGANLAERGGGNASKRPRITGSSAAVPRLCALLITCSTMVRPSGSVSSAFGLPILLLAPPTSTPTTQRGRSSARR